MWAWLHRWFFGGAGRNGGCGCGVSVEAVGELVREVALVVVGKIMVVTNLGSSSTIAFAATTVVGERWWGLNNGECKDHEVTTTGWR